MGLHVRWLFGWFPFCSARAEAMPPFGMLLVPLQFANGLCAAPLGELSSVALDFRMLRPLFVCGVP